MLRWLQRLVSRPAPVPAATPTPPAPPAAAPVPAEAPAPAAPPPSAAAAPPSGPAVPFEQAERITRAWNAWLFEREDDAGLETSEAEARVLDALAAILASQQSGAALVRRMPGLVPQLLQSLRSDSFSGSALSRTISSDPVLVAAVIRLADSAYEGAGKAVTSVEQAVILIGQEGLRQLITSVAFRPIIDLHSGYYTRRLAPRLWEHGERCAVGARRLADELGVEPFDAFLAGLLQNVGMIVALRIMDAETGGTPGLGGAVFLARLGQATNQLAASIAREWHFPEAVVRALLEQDGVRKGVQVSPLGRLVKLTGYLGRLRVLAEQELLDGQDPAHFTDLPPYAERLYAALGTA